MNPNLKTPPIELFGDVVLLQVIYESESGIVLPDGATPKLSGIDLYVVAVGDGKAVREKLKVGDRVELLNAPNPNNQASRRFYPGVHDKPFMLVGLDGIIGKLADKNEPSVSN